MIFLDKLPRGGGPVPPGLYGRAGISPHRQHSGPRVYPRSADPLRLGRASGPKKGPSETTGTTQYRIAPTGCPGQGGNFRRNLRSWCKMPASVYFIGANTAQWQRVKIGRAADVEDRRASLQTGSPVPLRLLGCVACRSEKHAEWLERRLHRQFAGYRVAGEWFQLSAPLREFIAATVAGDGEAARDSLIWARKQSHKRLRNRGIE